MRLPGQQSEMVVPATSPATPGPHPPIPLVTSAASPPVVFPSPIRRGVSRGYTSAPRVDYATQHGMTHAESGVFLT